MSEHESNGLFARASRAIAGIEPHEIAATVVSALSVFMLMASYYVLRPVRDAMASDWTDSEVSLLWNLNFFISTALIAAYGFAISRLRTRTIVPIVYGFFALSFLVFFLATRQEQDAVWIDKAFYLWVSVFALFHVSVFWSCMAQNFGKDQAKRLFGIIAAGASSGAILGPLMAAFLVTRVGTSSLLLIAACGLLLVIPLLMLLPKLQATSVGAHNELPNPAGKALGGNWWEGFRSLATNPYLLGIAAFILLYVFINTFVYFEQKNLLADFSRPERTQILAGIDGITNLLTFGLAFFATGRIVKRLGMPTGLALMPVLVAVGFLILAFAPLLTVLLAMQVVRRGGNYGLTRPAREMLFTQVSEQDRFKAKPVIDVAVYRGGDAVSGTIFALLTDGLGLGLAAVALVGAGIAGAWAWLGVRLGRVFDAVSGKAQ